MAGLDSHDGYPALFRHVFVRPSSLYELLDSGEGWKLERFGRIICARPEPQALWSKVWPEAEWHRQAHVIYRARSSHSGLWEKKKPSCPENWVAEGHVSGKNFRLKLALTAFKHVGLFPEQEDNWRYILNRSSVLKDRPFLNLFGYTGAATLAACMAGARAVHVDAVKQVVRWASENAALNSLEGIRWLVDDALSFVRREIRRGNRYAGIIMDPPAYGHGPKGESWKLEEHLTELLQLTLRLLEPGPCVYIVNSYSLGYSPVVLLNTLMRSLEKEKCKVQGLEYGELLLTPKKGFPLPAGIFARFDGIDKV